MTDLAFPVPRVRAASDASQAKLRARYRRESRFRAYGLIAIGLTCLFLFALLADILVKGLPAFVQHRLVLTIPIERSEVDPQNTRDPETIRAADFSALARNALRAQFPDVRDRANRRHLDAILSNGGADVLLNRVVSDPTLIGQSITMPVLLSADADLYYKGVGTRIQQRTERGTATVSGTTGEVAIATSTSVFGPELARVKSALAASAREQGAEAERLRSIALTLPPDRAGQREELEQHVRDLSARAAELLARVENAASPEVLSAAMPSLLVSINGGLIKLTEIERDRARGEVLLPLKSTEPAAEGTWQLVTYTVPESGRRLNDRSVAWLEQLQQRGLVQPSFNWAFFSSGDSREPELAGIKGALFGSALTLLVTLVLCLPIGVAAAIYLEEFAAKNRITEIIEVNINNLAAVPSIVFGLLGLAVFLNFFGLPRSAPLVGGLVLALLVLPTIIIAARAALKAVPPSIKEAALGVGASQQQAIFHHVLPLAMPGIMTGTIIGMAHALGETAPLLMIGMVAFIVEAPGSITDAATALPVQIFLWSDLPEVGFQAKTAAAIIVLLVFLFIMNGLAIFLRRRFERRW